MNKAISSYKNSAAIAAIDDQADKAEVVCQLYQAIIDKLTIAQKALENKDSAQEVQPISDALRIIQVLDAALDIENAQEEFVLVNHEIYEYACEELLQANLNKDVRRIRNVIKVIQPMLESWQQIKAMPPEQRQMPEQQPAKQQAAE